jgi:hypothetical protein
MIFLVFKLSSQQQMCIKGNKELVLTNKQKQFCKYLLFLRDTREKCFLRFVIANSTSILHVCLNVIAMILKKRKKCIENICKHQDY